MPIAKQCSLYNRFSATVAFAYPGGVVIDVFWRTPENGQFSEPLPCQIQSRFPI